MCMYLDDKNGLKWTCKNSKEVEMQVFADQDCKTTPLPSYKALVSHGARYEPGGGQIDKKVATIVGMDTTAFEVRFRKFTCKTRTEAKCPICVKSKKGKLSCCNKGGSWEGKCGDPGEKEYTWVEGAEACQSEPPKPPATDSECL